MSSQARVFKALSDDTRLKILEALAAQDMQAGEIAALFEVTQPSISYHLNALRSVGLINGRRLGQQVIYSLERAALESCWEDFFQRLSTKR